MTPTTPETPEMLCSAIWNGCVCARYPHLDHDDRHVWRNTLNGDMVDPALYPTADLDRLRAGSLDVERLRQAMGNVWDGRRVPYIDGDFAFRVAAEYAALTPKETE